MTLTCAFVFARGGSKGLPKKNVLPIGGLPMLAHGIRLALDLKEVDRIYVSTDCEEISAVAQLYGAEIIERPPSLASDNTPEWLAWQHAVSYVTQKFGPFDRFLSLPATAPLRSSDDVTKCLDALQDGIDMVITMTPSHRSPWFNMVIADDEQKLSLIAGDGSVIRRQDAVKCFDMTTVAYVTRPGFITSSSSIWDGTVVGVEIPRKRAIDIDDELDYSIATYLMSQSIQS